MGLLAFFIVALVNTAATGAIAFIVAKQFAERKSASIAAFWLAVGSAGSRYSVSDLPTMKGVAQLCAFLGMAVALGLLWYWLFRRRVEEAA